MQQKRNIRLLISLGVLIVITVVVIFLFNRETATVDKTIFQVADLKTIDKVVLKHDSVTTELALDGVRWKVNGQSADRSMIDVLFATLQQAEPKRKVSDKLTDSLRTHLEKNGIHVSLYQGGEIAQEFFAGGNASKTQAYFTKAGDDEVYVMVIPGYRVYTSGIFELEAPGWKDKYVFNFNWENFTGLAVSFAASPVDNFEVVMDKQPEIKGVQADTARLYEFLDNVSLLTVDQYLTKQQAAAYDSALFTSLGFEIVIADISGKTYSLKLYPEIGKSVVFGVVQGLHPAIFDSRKILPLMRSKGWFVKK